MSARQPVRLEQGVFDLPEVAAEAAKEAQESPDEVAQSQTPERDNSRSSSPHLSRREKREHRKFSHALADETTPDSADSSHADSATTSVSAVPTAEQQRFLTEKETRGQGDLSQRRQNENSAQLYETDLLAGQGIDVLFSPSAPRRPARRSVGKPEWQIGPDALGLAMALYSPDFAFTHGFWNRLQELIDHHDVCFDEACRGQLEQISLLDIRGSHIFGSAPLTVTMSGIQYQQVPSSGSAESGREESAIDLLTTSESVGQKSASEKSAGKKSATKKSSHESSNGSENSPGKGYKTVISLYEFMQQAGGF